MAWTIGSWSGGEDWSDVAILQEFYDACSERKKVAEDGDPLPFVNPSVGMDAQDKDWFADMQAWLETYCARFVVSHDAGAVRSNEYWDGRATIDEYADLADVLSHMGKGYSDWRRYADAAPSEGGTVQYGRVQAGDILGYWIFEDLMTVLNALVWTTNWGFDVQGDHDDENNWSEGDDRAQPWATAKTNAEADYGNEGSSVAWGPTKYSYGKKYDDGTGDFFARLRAVYQYLQITLATAYGADDIGATFECYAKTVARGGDVWDDQGDGWVHEAAYSLFDTEVYSPGGATTFLSDACGNLTQPDTWVAEPTDDLGDYRGWESDGEVAVARWDFTYKA